MLAISRRSRLLQELCALVKDPKQTQLKLLVGWRWKLTLRVLLRCREEALEVPWQWPCPEVSTVQ